MTTKHKLDHSVQQFLITSLGGQPGDVIQLAGDASSRRYYRIVINDLSYVLMVWEPFIDNGQFPFLNVLSHFDKSGVKVPKVIAKAPALGVILLEDLGDLTLERKFWENQNQNLALPYYKQSIDEILKIHYTATKNISSPCVAFQVQFNTEKLLWEMNYGRDHFLTQFCKINLGENLRRELDRIFLDICSFLDRQPKVICHRDYHSRNIMLKHGKTKVIDFQDARMGAIQYDLVSLVHDSYVDLSPELSSEIIEYYLIRAKEMTGHTIERNNFYDVFRIQMIQRCFKACGSFASFFNMREDTRYLKYLTPTIKKVYAVLEPYEEYRAFSQIILDNGLLEKNFLALEEAQK
jgi:aminoglycoside/choline kinase family phosphotransferase